MGLSFVACYYPTFRWLNYKYSTPDSYYSHGYLIPFVVLYLIYDKRHDLKKAAIGTNLYGLLGIAMALLIHVLGVFSNTHFISGFSIILFLISCSFYLYGTVFTKHLLFPLLYLIFMMPIPNNYLTLVALPSKSAATWSALKILDLLNIPYLRDGFAIVLSNSTFIVGAPCNGLRSLISFFALGFLIIYFRGLTILQSLLLLAIIPFLAVLMNGIRIVILLLISIFYGQEAASPESFLHDASGLFVFGIGLVLMMVVIRVMNAKESS
jgi:exosortase